ncbi:hypothetical protein [Maledivibacter halophilus]|uniref:GIY-YIG domain-containing protein n=1 Tax=Maledivibacter halophilus TaxID=36842 RepID=A0A1T5KYC7_9FIRM|nr:hypothetical protein [Maledivibacter halophilus]SKC68786.1 hypothetical protein SAMN02194393_02189 [Maledivibacter halophilus]
MSRYCEILHKQLSNLQRYSFPFDKNPIPKNGIYILFEKGETGHGVDRIVRIGTHTGDNQLVSRLKQHFIKENKDRSIFRKNIGRSILNKNKDNYLERWEWDLTSRKNREKYMHLVDLEYQMSIEKKVSKYIRENFSFAVISIENKDSRLNIESKLISEVSNCSKCISSSNWLGNYSPKNKIRQSGLWLVNELYKDGFSKTEFEKFLKLIN